MSATDERPAAGQPARMRETERVVQGPGPGRGPFGGGMVGQKSSTFGPSAKRLLRRMQPERSRTVAVLALAVTIALAGLTVRYHDISHLVPLALTILFYATPIVYPPSLVPDAWQGVLDANPAGVVVRLFHATLYGGPWPPAWASVLCTTVAVVGFAAATAWYRVASDRFVAEA